MRNDEYNFLKIKNQYFIQYQGEIFNLHKPKDIRCRVYLLNREKGFSELQCEYNDVNQDNDMVKVIDGKTFIRI